MAKTQKTGKDKEVKSRKVSTVKEALPDFKPGMTVRVHQTITESGSKGDKERVQIFEGIILAHKGGKGVGATITVRKVSDGIGVEKIFPVWSPTVVKIEPVKQAHVRKSKLYYLRGAKKRLKETRLTA